MRIWQYTWLALMRWARECNEFDNLRSQRILQLNRATPNAIAVL
jgi:hypothetical protein